MIIRDVQFVMGAARWEQLPRDGRPEVAFVGRSNVGKSSLLNMLVGQSLARISGTPGKTQQFN
jgi:GTP-binding protein